MNLKKLLRSDFENNIRNNLIKDRCEYCGEVNNLNLHHIELKNKSRTLVTLVMS